MRLRKAPLFSASVLLLLAWGALAFGAEYAWAYAPLLVFGLVVAVLGFRARPERELSMPAVFVALLAVFVAGAVQLVPLPASIVATVTPNAAAHDFRGLYANAINDSPPAEPGRLRSLSIAPSRTMLGLALFAALILLFAGTTLALAATGPTTIARGIAVLGIAVALAGILQRALGSDLVYGWWYPPKRITPFAPFINHDHFCGWVVMVMSLAVGDVAGVASTGLRSTRPGWRNGLLWLSSPDASDMMLGAFGVAVMAMAIVVSASRSGLICLVSALFLCAAFVVRRQSSRVGRTVFAVYVVAVLVIAASWGQIDAVLVRFPGVTTDLGGRLAVWRDAAHVMRDFPITGTGLNTFGIAMLHYQTVSNGELFIESHNDYLQLLAEGGLLLGIPVAIAVVLFVREIWRRFSENNDDTRVYWIRVGAVVGICAIAIQEAVDFTLQMPGATVLFVVLAAIAVHRPVPALAPVHPLGGSATPLDRAAFGDRHSPIGRRSAAADLA